MRALVGGAFGREFRQLKLNDAVFAALLRGLVHKNPNVRFACIQIMDHVGDDRIIEPVSRMLHDWAPRVRKQALRALTCEKCKSTALCPLPVHVVEHFIDLALHDPNRNVRVAAVTALGTLPPNQRISESLHLLLETDTELKILQAAQQTLNRAAQNSFVR